MTLRTRILVGLLVVVATAGAVVSWWMGGSRDMESGPEAEPAAAIPGDGITLRSIVHLDRSVTDLQNAGDGTGRLFVLEKTGRIRLLRDGALLSEPYLDMESLVLTSSGERGLLGLAFAPDFADSGRFYVNYTGADGITQIARLTVDPTADVVDTSSLEVLLAIEQPYPNHNGGQLRFGPDGMLWIGTGDGGSGGDPEDRAENPESLLGKMLRIDVSGDGDYAIPPGNAYPNGEGGRPEIWAIGLRNPWRYAFDPETNDLWIADVGQNRWEEVHRVAASAPPGTHFGWNTFEGTHCYASEEDCASVDALPPVYEYSHDEGCSISGGVVYRGAELPELAGTYLFADFCNTWIHGLVPDGAGGVQKETIFPPTSLRVVAFGEDEAHEVYVVGLSGRIYRLERT